MNKIILKTPVNDNVSLFSVLVIPRNNSLALNKITIANATDTNP